MPILGLKSLDVTARRTQVQHTSNMHNLFKNGYLTTPTAVRRAKKRCLAGLCIQCGTARADWSNPNKMPRCQACKTRNIMTTRRGLALRQGKPFPKRVADYFGYQNPYIPLEVMAAAARADAVAEQAEHLKKLGDRLRASADSHPTLAKLAPATRERAKAHALRVMGLGDTAPKKKRRPRTQPRERAEDIL